jgi:release factor glutamine methyltransferase
MPSIAEALDLGTRTLAPYSDSARLDTELLLAHTLQKPRTYLHAWDDIALSDAQWQHYQQLIAERGEGRPIAHLLGEKGFWSLTLHISADTLIPRPETELLVEIALERIPVDACARVMDLGTGSGAIALALAHERPAIEVLATDSSVAALQVARANAARLGLANVRFVEGDWFAAVPEKMQADVIVSNPPYIATADPHLRRGDVRFEPATALQSGEQGLDDLRRIIAGAPAHLLPGGWLAVEHGYDQAGPVEALFAEQDFAEVQQKQDLGGHPRVTLGRKAGV